MAVFGIMCSVGYCAAGDWKRADRERKIKRSAIMLTMQLAAVVWIVTQIISYGFDLQLIKGVFIYLSVLAGAYWLGRIFW